MKAELKNEIEKLRDEMKLGLSQTVNRLIASQFILLTALGVLMKLL
jgi:hypothetical protein